MTAWLVILSGLTCLIVWFSRKFRSWNNPPLPPGPPGEPFIGHLRLIPPDDQPMQFYKLGKTYGEVVHLNFLGRSVIVLNGAEAATELLEKRGANYSDRPAFPFFSYIGWSTAESSLAFLGYGKQFQKHRRLLQDYLGKTRSLAYRHIQIREAGIMLQNLLMNDSKRDTFIRQFATTVVMRIVYGHQITSKDDPYVKIAADTGYALSNGGPPGGTPVDLFPFLIHFPSWFPGTYYAEFARRNRSAIEALHEYPFKEVKKQMAEGKAKPSFLAHYLDELQQGESDGQTTAEDIKGAAGMMYCAGVDAVWSSLSIFFLAMAIYPECQVRAQQEIDSVIGSERLPTFDDRASLPYVEAVLQESLRWNSSSPLGVPHRSMEDDVYKGMFIPKGSLLIACTRSITLDDRVYADPFEFNPSRYLPAPEGRSEPHPSTAFGYGRRICPGRFLADASLWISVASVLATLSISKALDESGNEVAPCVGFSNGITSHPHPYECRVGPRNERAKALAMQAADTWNAY